jgi:serine/threonine protein kinase
VPAVPRFQIVTEFSAFEGWRNCLAVDRREAPPRPVVLSFVPARLADDPARLARLAEDVERAARLFHPAILRVLGMDTFRDQPVVVQEWRDGESLRELLDTGARVPPEVAARIIADACEAVQHSHGRAVEQGRPFAHGALRAERVLVGIDGAVQVSGFGRAAEGDGPVPSPVDDVRELGKLLLQCLAGEQPSGAGLPGVPDALAAVASRAAETDRAFDSAESFRKALAASVPLANAERVKAWADGVLPPETGTRGRRRRSLEAALAASVEEVSDDSIVATATPVPGTYGALRHGASGSPARASGAEPAQQADDLIVGEATGPLPAPRREDGTQDADDLIVGEATGPTTKRRPGEKTPEIAFPRPPPTPIVAWRVVMGTAGVALVAGLAIGAFLGR